MSSVAVVLSPIMQLKVEILAELATNLPKLLALNPSRREAVARHLHLLSGIPFSADAGKAAEVLRRWIEDPRTPAQTRAFNTYLEEVALIFLGQILLLKAWSDRGLRPWKQADVANLNWALSTTLKPQIPLDREGWQITRPNLYSWYTPSTGIQGRIWTYFEPLRLADDGPGFLASLLQGLKQVDSEESALSSARGYDTRFFTTLWQTLDQYQLLPQPVASMGGLGMGTLAARPRTAFSPTLRDGSIIRSSPVSLNWIGLEFSPYQLLVAELAQLWWGPSAPPLWTQGTGLEAHGRDQMSFPLQSPKPSILSRITEMEACELAVILEERCLRPHARSGSPDGKLLLQTLDSLPYFKKLRAPGTTLGDLQACVAITKLRPGGLLFWAREEPLSSDDGEAVLKFMLERSLLTCEWNFSELKHHLPSGVGLFPRYLYCFKREPDLGARMGHRPLRVAIEGQIRSHVEVPIVLEDALRAGATDRGELRATARGNWSIQPHRSPASQQEWMERWPDPASQDSKRALEQLESGSLRFANFAAIRPTPIPRPIPGAAAPAPGAPTPLGWSMHPAVQGLWIRIEQNGDERRVRAESLPRPGFESDKSGFVAVLSDESWVAPLCAYFESNEVRDWLDHHCERRAGKWVLQEQTVKWIPVPRALLSALNVPEASSGGFSHALPLPGEWEQIASDVAQNPARVRMHLENFGDPATIDSAIHAAIFVRAARALATSRTGENRLRDIVAQDGTIRWAELLSILPKAECVGIPFHSRVRISGNLPPHSAIVRADRVKSPSPGILLSTETGFNLHLGCELPMILDMLEQQICRFQHPTWAELLEDVRLPRRIELARETAEDLMRSHGQQNARVAELQALLDICQLF